MTLSRELSHFLRPQDVSLTLILRSAFFQFRTIKMTAASEINISENLVTWYSVDLMVFFGKIYFNDLKRKKNMYKVAGFLRW